MKKKRRVPWWVWLIGGLIVLAAITPRSAETQAESPSQVEEAPPQPATDEALAADIAALIRGEGLDCTPVENGRSCGGESARASSVSLSEKEGHQTLLLSGIQFDPAALGPNTGNLSVRHRLIAGGPLEGYYVQQIGTNSGDVQLNIRNKAAYEWFEN